MTSRNKPRADVYTVLLLIALIALILANVALYFEAAAYDRDYKSVPRVTLNVPYDVQNVHCTRICANIHECSASSLNC